MKLFFLKINLCFCYLAGSIAPTSPGPEYKESISKDETDESFPDSPASTHETEEENVRIRILIKFLLESFCIISNF